MSFLISVGAFLAILAPLVVIHELGHFLFARLFNVKAEAFSIGFGPKLFSRTWGETNFRLSLIPLGGYVKLLGEDRTQPLTAEESRRALHTQAPWKRFLIFFGGPLFNFLGAILIFMAVLMIGEKEVASVVGRVVPGSPAEKAGFVSGDRIERVGDQAVSRWEDILTAWSTSAGKSVSVQVERGGQTRTFSVTPEETDGFTLYGEQKKIGEVDGLLPVPRNTTVGVSDPGSVAGRAGIRTGLVVRSLSVGGQVIPVENWENFESAVKSAPQGADISAAFALPDGELKTIHLGQKRVNGGREQLDAWGLCSNELFVEKVLPGTPAEKAGLQAGDRLWSINGDRILSFFELRSRVQSEGEKSGSMEIAWMRNGEVIKKQIQPSGTASRNNALLSSVTTYTIGVMPMAFQGQPVWTIEQVFNPLLLIYRATEKVVVLTYRNLVSIGKMIAGQVSTTTLGGPIMIGKIAGEAITSGLSEFLTRMAFFSIGLGVLNLMPIPVLDGGHIVLLAIERIRRKPLTLKQLSIAQLVGLMLILTLMGKVFFNDITRL